MYRKYFKRWFDLVISFGAMIVLSPLFLIVSILVRIKLGGPVLFTQNRPGLNGEIFKIYKFRSMTNEKDDNGLLLSDEIRLTDFGKLLRSTSLDELPELINIIKGDMSIVGPRPLLVQYLEFYNDEQKRRHDVRPGLTGLAQVNGRNSLSWKEKFVYDVTYVDHYNLMYDIRIIVATVREVFSRKGIDSDENGTMYPFTGDE